MPHILEQYTENLGNVVDNEQKTPISERTPKEVVLMNIFTGGEQTSQSGMTHTFKESDLDQVVESYNPDVHLAPLIRGHDEKDDGAPSSGWVKEVIRRGRDLFAYVALTGFGQQNLEEGNFKKVSCRFYPPEDPANPTPGKLSLRHLALVTIPAVKGLQEFSENRDRNQDWDFSLDLSYSFAEENSERKEVKKSIVQAMEKLMLDGEDMEPAGSPDVQKMELTEEEKEKKKKDGEPVDFKPHYVGMTDKSKFILDGEDTILEDVEFSEKDHTPVSKIAKNDNDEETVHDADTERQKEYRKIIKDTVPVEYNEAKEENPMDKIMTLVEALLKNFSPQSATDPTPQLKMESEEEESVGEDKEDLSGFMPLDGTIEIEIIKTDEDMEMGEDNGRCWEGYEPVPGKEPYEEGSCRKKTDHGEMEHGENIDEPMDYPTTEDIEAAQEEVEEVKKVELIVPKPRKPKKITRLADQSYSESISAELSGIEKQKQRMAWNDFAEAYYSEGVLVESIVSKEELVDSLMFLDNQTSNLSFSEGQINPLDTIKKLLDRMPPVVGLNGFEPTPKANAENMFKDQLPGEESNALVYSENNVAFDNGSMSIHQQALQYSEKHGVDYYSAIQKVIG